jgi:hypothetical protein
MNSQLNNQKYIYQSLAAAMFAESDNRPDLAELFVDFAVALACKGVEVEVVEAVEKTGEVLAVWLPQTVAA